MMRNRCANSRQIFKAQVVLELLSGKKTLADLSREHDIKDSLIYT